jgi:transketolase
MLTYVDTLFSEKLIIPYRDRIVLGKPFGSQAYYLVWHKLGYIDNIDHLSIGVKHDEIPFVDYSEETMGNALGVAIGIAIARPEQKVWVNITDATLQMGSTLEAIQYIGHHNIQNITVTVDYNDMQVTGATSNVLDVKPVISLCTSSNWDVHINNGHEYSEIIMPWKALDINTNPTIIFYKTIKGYGVNYMVDDPVKWHYKQISHYEKHA